MFEIGCYDDLYPYVIAQDDDCDYSESGYVAVVKDGQAALGSYSHCSCYGTWETVGWDWEGTVAELVDLARRKADPIMPTREADAGDHDYDHLMRVYEQIISWASAGSAAAEEWSNVQTLV